MSTGISNDTIQDALQRAKQLAAQTTAPQHEDLRLKRPAGDDFEDPYASGSKRVATDETNGDGSSVAANMMDMAGMANPIATLGGDNRMPPGMVGMPGGPPMGGTGGPTPDQLIETIDVPDNCVGLVIGRQGSEIQNIQTQSGCRVQMSPETNGQGMRTATLTGNKMAVEKAKQMIMEVVQRAGDRPPPGNRFMAGGPGMDGAQNGGRVQTFEMTIPGMKCGLIIGKGGETIKNIQETAGVKMILIQERQDVGMLPKPLRIIGEPEKVEHARKLVEEILQSRDEHPPSQGGPRPGFNAYGSPMGGMMGMGGPPGGGGPRSIGEVIVPRQSVGMIIGKGGETIKRLAAESGAKIQFKPDDLEDQNSQDRCAIIQGSTEQITRATQLISDLVNKSSGSGQEIFYMHVPANKTGLVIGKGGETIKQICGESGAHVELSREPPPNAMEKIFVIKGSPYQIHHAQHIVRIKVGDIAPGTPVPPFAGPGGDFAQHGFNPAAAGGPYGQQTAAAWPNAYGGMGQQQGDPNAAAAAWTAAYYGGQQPQQQQQQFGQPQAAPAPQYQFAGQQQQAQPAGTQQPQQQPAQQQQQAPAINPQTGQPDYSAQWAEYYRSLGMHEQASMIEQQAKAGGGAAAPQQQQQPAQQPQPTAVVPGAQQQQRPQGYGAAQYGGAPAQPNQFNQFGAPQAQPQQGGYQFQAQY